MARRLLSVMVPKRGGPRAGGSNWEISVYDDETLTTPSTLYRRGTGGGTQPNPLKPNAGANSALLADRAAGDAFVTVVDVAAFQVGDLVPIYNGTTTAYKVITLITPATKRLDLDETLGTAFAASNTKVGDEDMQGHIWCYLEDTRDYHVQVKDVSSGRLLPPVSIPAKLPTSTITFEKDDLEVATRGRLDVRAMFDVVDDAGSSRVRLEFRPAITNSDGATVTMDFATGTWHRVTLGGNRTLAFSNGKDGGKYAVELIQDATGGRTVSWPATVKWPGGVAPTLSTAATKRDFLGFLYDGTSYWGVAVALGL